MSNNRHFQVGLVEKEWLDTLSAVDPEHVTYTDYVECGRLCKALKKTLPIRDILIKHDIVPVVCSGAQPEGYPRLQNCDCLNPHANT